MSFTWIPLYRELAENVLQFEHRQLELIALLERFERRGMQIGSLNDQGANAERFPLRELDPFSFFAMFNWQGKRPENRRAILNALREEWHLSAAVPDDFDGVPLANRQSLWLFHYQVHRDPDDVSRLWDFAKQVVTADRMTVDQGLMRRLLNQRMVGSVKLSIGMFWLNPREFLPADKWTRGFMERRGVPEAVWNAGNYFHWLDKSIEVAGTDFPSISLAAFKRKGHPLLTALRAESRRSPMMRRFRNHSTTVRQQVGFDVIGG